MEIQSTVRVPMAVPEVVDWKLLKELEAMGFPVAKATNALHQSGNCSIEDAVKWIMEHETEPKIDEVPLVPVKIPTIKSDNILKGHAEKSKAEESRKEYLKRKRHYDKQLRSKKAKVLECEETLQVVAGQLNTLEIQVESNVDSRKRWNTEPEKDSTTSTEPGVSTTTIQKLEKDMHRQLNLGLPSKIPDDVKHAYPMLGKTTKKIEQLRECLRSIKGNHQGDEGEVETTFRTLSAYVTNVLKSPDEEKFKRIRVANTKFRSRVGQVRGGIDFLHLCGFEWTEDSDFLHLPCNTVDPALLNSARTVLDSALSNRFFGMLCRKSE